MVKIPPKSKLFTPRQQIQDIANTRRGVEVQLDQVRERTTEQWRNTELATLNEKIRDLQRMCGVVHELFRLAPKEIVKLEKRLTQLARDEKLIEHRAKVERLQKIGASIKELEAV